MNHDLGLPVALSAFRSFPIPYIPSTYQATTPTLFFFPSFYLFAAKRSGGEGSSTYKLVQTKPEALPLNEVSYILGWKSASVESNFSAVRKIVASAHKILIKGVKF